MKFLYPLLHKYTLRRDVNCFKYPWGWVSQEVVTALLKQRVPDNVEGYRELEEKGLTLIHEQNVSTGVSQGYIAILDLYRSGGDFLHTEFTTPKLSCAINDFIKMGKEKELEIPDINTSDLKVDILDSWVEAGIAHSNDKILGMWTADDVKRDILIGAAGPEFLSWYTRPLRQRVRVKYTLPKEGRIDLWVWERQLVVEKRDNEAAGEEGDWTVCNINGILESSVGDNE